MYYSYENNSTNIKFIWYQVNIIIYSKSIHIEYYDYI
jgi:hypothetical protein